MQILCCLTHLSTASVEFRAGAQARRWFPSWHDLRIHSHLSPWARPQQTVSYGLFPFPPFSGPCFRLQHLPRSLCKVEASWRSEGLPHRPARLGLPSSADFSEPCLHFACDLCIRGSSALDTLAMCSWPCPDPNTAFLSLSQDSGGRRQFMSKECAWCLRE